MLVGIQAKEDAIEERGGVILNLEVAVEFEELWEEGKDKGEGYLVAISLLILYGQNGHTRSSNKEIKMTRKICFLLAWETGIAGMIGSKW